MTLQPMWPIWLIVVVFGLLFTLVFVALFTTTHRLRWVRRAVLVLALLAVVLRPTSPLAGAPTVESNVDVFFVVDRTGSMAAEDYNGTNTRLTGVKKDMVSLARGIPGGSFAIISFDSEATRQLPLTKDVDAVASWADTLVQESSSTSQGSSIDRPLDRLTTTLEAAHNRNPHNIRLVYFLSDGEQTTDEEPNSFEAVKQHIDGGAVLGYGTEQGGRMRYTGAGSTAGSYILDYSQPDTPVAISVIDEENLNALAKQLGVPYEHRTTPTSTEQLTDGIDIELLKADGRTSSQYFEDWYWIPAIIAALLAVWDLQNTAALWPRKPKQPTNGSNT